MARKCQRETVRFIVDDPVEIEKGVMLPPGEYAGLMEQHGYDAMDGVSWASPKYKIELSADEWQEMGGKVERDLVSTVVDLTKFVKQRLIEVD